MLCADAVGAATAALDHTVERVKAREQWGAPIGTFQAVQHRCADMLLDVTTARDAVYDAAGAVDRGDDAVLAASRAKAFAIDASRRVTAAAHQLGGGEGIYADQPVHLWYRRVKAIEPMYGSPDFHRAGSPPRSWTRRLTSPCPPVDSSLVQVTTTVSGQATVNRVSGSEGGRGRARR